MPHTPGPWRVDVTKAAGSYGVWTDYATHPGEDGAGYGSCICSMLPMDGHVPQEQRDANALLISAAPDLLAACEAALKFKSSPLDLVSVAGDMLRDAVLKAKGRKFIQSRYVD